MTSRKIYHKDFYFFRSGEWYIIPTIHFYYTSQGFLETGIYTPAFTLGFKWLNYNATFRIQEGYEQT